DGSSGLAFRHVLVPCAGERSLKRWILPVAVFGRSVTNSIQRGYLNGASSALTWSCSAEASAGPAAWPGLSTTKAFGLISSLASAQPTTAASRAASCVASAGSTSNGDTYTPPTLSMSSVRPQETY